MKIHTGVNYFRVLPNLYKRLEMAYITRDAYAAWYYSTYITVVEAYLRGLKRKHAIQRNKFR